MCGIFAYSGPKKTAGEIVIRGLKKLEYRGYDSWGIAFNEGGRLGLLRKVGKIGEFNLEHETLKQSTLAIGHSRWATHGGVTELNAHPHLDKNAEFAVVHNGIIENYREIKKELLEKGYEFKSETDTEAIVHLLADNAKGKDFVTAARLTLKQLRGRYAILLIHAGEQKIVAARRGSPLIVGVGEKEFFIASDIPAFLEHTRKVMYIDDDEMVVINAEPHFYNLDSDEEIEKRVVQIDWKEESAEKGNFKHFMIKEIMEQKETIYRAINQLDDDINKLAEEIKKAYGTFLIGCGTAGKVCLAASYIFSKVAKRHVNVVIGSEFPSHQDFLKEKSLVIAVSQSGETADTLEAIEVAKKKGSKVLSIINVEGSTMDRMSDFAIHIKAGPEKAVASTKATTSQLAILTLLAYATAGRLPEGKRLLIETAGKINDMLNPRYEEHIHNLAEKIKDVESMYVIGKAMNFPMALEAAIKLQEVSYIHAEGFAGGELKHGPIALISKGTPCIVLVANDETRTDILNNAQEVKARGGYIIGVSPQQEDVFDDWIKVPDAGEASAIVNIIPIQLLAYHLAVLRQNNPDMPRNLAKSVTVK
ncbi:MAG TPA: glutamine--fructose-6-phosphate transaminase (isomerizing) [Candidatus Gracilibacteria bacterium]|nr:glutamine--fructose-6-phosphate transaminase (isomerizing) [Candidatus Gracilibacteria bacterium]